jgi:hypothetical protein
MSSLKRKLEALEDVGSQSSFEENNAKRQKVDTVQFIAKLKQF